jgi:hypothetical protein
MSEETVRWSQQLLTEYERQTYITDLSIAIPEQNQRNYHPKTVHKDQVDPKQRKRGAIKIRIVIKPF